METKTKESVRATIAEIRELVKERTGAECPAWLGLQIEAAAMNRQLLWQILEELSGLGSSLIVRSEGYNGQTKTDAHPLLGYYDKIQRTLLMQYEAIGINYKTTPRKVTESTQKGISEEDPMAQMYADAKL